MTWRFDARERMRRGESYFVALDLIDIAEAAQEFVATTSVFRQRRESRDAFEALAIALVRASNSQSRAEEPQP